MKLYESARRLNGALRRHGPAALFGGLAQVVRARGLAGAVALAASGRPFLATSSPTRSAPRHRAWPPVLDERRRLPEAVFRRWLQARLRGPAPAPSTGRPPIVRLKAEDRPEPALAARLALAFADPAVKIVTFDMFRQADGQIEPLFLPGANPVLLKGRDYIFSRAAFRVGFPDAETQPPRELILRWCAERSVEEVRRGWRHLGEPLLQAAISDGEIEAARQDALGRLGRAQAAPSGKGASAVICTRDNGHLTRQLVRSLTALPAEVLAEVVIVSNGTANPYALQTLADLSRNDRVRVVSRDEPFNFSRLCNAGARECRSSGPLLFLNDDVVPVSDRWLDALLWRLGEPGAGAVGPLLLYPRERVQHAGMSLRRLGGAGHPLRGARLPEDDYLCLAAVEREVSCLTGAVVLTRRDAFDQAGGFDEGLAIGLQDVDFGLKLHQAGLRNVFEPRAVLLHMESVSVGGAGQSPVVAEQRYQDWRRFVARWGPLVDADPFGLSGFDPEDETLHRLARP